MRYFKATDVFFKKKGGQLKERGEIAGQRGWLD